MKLEQPIWLASKSPRRYQMLREAGLDVKVAATDIDDALLRRGRVTPREWVMALAYLKARRGLDSMSGGDGTVLGADTVCVAADGEILGQPRDASDARRMLRKLRGAEHRTMTGVCLLPVDESLALTPNPSPKWRGESRRMMFVDSATVHIGELSDRAIEEYVESGQWRGKAGAYNLSERIDAGWPIECVGDPATVMGLPMRRLLKDSGSEQAAFSRRRLRENG